MNYIYVLGREEEKSYWESLWDKASRFGSSILKDMIGYIIEELLLESGKKYINS